MKVYVIKEHTTILRQLKHRYFLIIPELQYVSVHYLYHRDINLKTAIAILPYPAEDYHKHDAVECFITKSKHADSQYIAHILDVSNYPHLFI